MSWLYVPVAVDLNSESVSPSTISERLAEASATWRGKLQPPPAWSRLWMRDGFIRRLSGLTLPHSTANHGVASFISSLREIPAKTIPSPESAPDPMESDSLRLRSAASPKSAGLILSSARTFRGTLTDNLPLSPQHWKNWTTALRQEYSVRPRPVIPCNASDYSSWPAPRANDAEKRGAVGDDPRNGLVAEAEYWMGPVASDTTMRTQRYAQGGMPLSMQVNQANISLTWPAPACRDHKGSSASSITRKDGKSRLNMLDFAAEQLFRLPSSQDQPIAGGAMSSTDGPNSNQPSVRRKLNPIFVEALMRWPTGLSGFERPETAWTRWWLLMRSYLSGLCSPRSSEQMNLF